MDGTCAHLTAAAAHQAVTPSGPGCAECLATRGVWVHLRLCLGCGHVGCCDSSPGRHATKHARRAEHPVIRSYEPDESWGYCYLDDGFVEELPAHPGERAPRHFDPPGG
ncbi:MAG TPA: UBP-type zinc finger domain-containing protein [Polyangia bacterium]|nr:UBP-type zinc finger domain-containing protein [Polyangia bacterium]